MNVTAHTELLCDMDIDALVMIRIRNYMSWLGLASIHPFTQKFLQRKR